MKYECFVSSGFINQMLKLSLWSLKWYTSNALKNYLEKKLQEAQLEFLFQISAISVLQVLSKSNTSDHFNT